MSRPLGDLLGTARELLVAEGCGEPQTLTDLLGDEAAALAAPPVHLRTGVVLRAAPYAAAVAVTGFMPGRGVARVRNFAYRRLSYSGITAAFRSGELRVDATLVQVAPAGRDGRHSLGVHVGYLPAVLATGTRVVAEVNARMPDVPGAPRLPASVIDAAIPSDRSLHELPAAQIGTVERYIGGFIAGLLPRRPVLEVGLGAIPQAALGALAGRGDVSVHSGMVTDSVVDLARSGGLASRAADGGPPVRAGTCMGTARLFEWAATSGMLEMASSAEIHDPAVLAEIPGFVAVNGALSVDLAGNVNTETAAGKLVSGLGGQPDFAVGAHRAPGGMSIIALPTRTRDGIPRVVANVETVSTPARHVDAVVTEYGVAILAGRDAAERAARVVAVAHPDDRRSLHEAIAAGRAGALS